MDNLYGQLTSHALDIELREGIFPKELSEVYERIIERIRNNIHPEREWPITWKLLSWIACAARPLKWHELQGAISIDFEKEEVNFNLYQSHRHIHELCGALVSVVGDRVSLVHSTAKHFISKSKYIDAPVAECSLAIVCIHYLCFHCFSESTADDELHGFVRNGYFAFADYAIAKWTYHFRQVCGLAETLLEPSTSGDREVVMQELCEAVSYFAEKYDADLEHSLSRMAENEVAAQIQPTLLRSIAEFGGVDNTSDAFRLIWAHSEMQRFKDLQSRNLIIPEKLRIGSQRMRACLENIFSNKHLPQDIKDELVTFYGSRIYKCSRTTCFYFHEGFVDKRSRDLHDSRHSRPFVCSEVDCEAGDFGFTSKRDLEIHCQIFHPNIEMKASLFDTVKPVLKNKTKFECSKCDRVYTRNENLKAHELTHTGQKPHECSKCGTGFTRKDDRNRHEKIHENRRK
ncbi:hypothetical protein LTS08_008069 [Lithohypha guttulata]|uniref:C2H2-type domain-containing protein n=1 Tax=Lithohypha guttulata TaxID=1690604 RepID=A0AAN7T1U6_9EURO|nr:hypothetical protein LTR51_005081 [Lithohypha guttulata]KAK5087830.1 hypothetical protein LTR05_002045 [Lithohypha guttulata]KAK5095427.1 hypothetical protein LTS08_008069 [Lithohypha guttulata]